MDNNNIKFPVPRVSYFKGPVTDIRPAGVCDLREIGEMIRRDERLECLTREYRALTDKEERREFKKTRLPYITPSGVFSKRMADGFVRHSGLVCLDFDDVRNYDLLRCDLLHDKCYETAFLFRSPSGGLKWFVCLPWMNEANDFIDNAQSMWFTCKLMSPQEPRRPDFRLEKNFYVHFFEDHYFVDGILNKNFPYGKYPSEAEKQQIVSQFKQGIIDEIKSKM